MGDTETRVGASPDRAMAGSGGTVDHGAAADAVTSGWRVRARRFWYGDPCSVRAREAERLRTVQLRLIGRRLRQLDAERETLRAQLGDDR